MEPVRSFQTVSPRTPMNKGMGASGRKLGATGQIDAEQDGRRSRGLGHPKVLP
jgi:hypothetical protein